MRRLEGGPTDSGPSAWLTSSVFSPGFSSLYWIDGIVFVSLVHGPWFVTLPTKVIPWLAESLDALGRLSEATFANSGALTSIDIDRLADPSRLGHHDP